MNFTRTICTVHWPRTLRKKRTTVLLSCRLGIWTRKLPCLLFEAAKILPSPCTLINLWHDIFQASCNFEEGYEPEFGQGHALKLHPYDYCLLLRWNPSLQLLLWQSHNFERLLANEFTGIISELAQLSFCKSELPGRAGLKACKKEASPHKFTQNKK